MAWARKFLHCLQARQPRAVSQSLPLRRLDRKSPLQGRRTRTYVEDLRRCGWRRKSLKVLRGNSDWTCIGPASEVGHRRWKNRERLIKSQLGFIRPCCRKSQLPVTYKSLACTGSRFQTLVTLSMFSSTATVTATTFNNEERP